MPKRVRDGIIPVSTYFSDLDTWLRQRTTMRLNVIEKPVGQKGCAVEALSRGTLDCLGGTQSFGE